MRHRVLALAGSVAFVSTAVLATSISVAAQTQPRVAKLTAKAPLASDGHPDLSGIWDYRTITPLERPSEFGAKDSISDEESADFEKKTVEARNQDRRDGRGTDADVSRAYNDFWWDFGKKVVKNRTSLVVEPPDGRIPALTAEGKARADQQTAARNRPAAGPEDRNLWERCLTRTLPRLPGAYNNNFQIVQTADVVAIQQEMIHEVRLIPLDGRPHVSGSLRQWLGDSRGHWEGKTLVVETTNFNGKSDFRGSGANLRLIERFTRIDADTLNYDVTIDDSSTWTKPWTVSVPMVRNLETIYEYACHEGNYGLPGILAGARAQEAAAEEAAKKGSR
jgi:hypothetical protein